MVGGLVAAGCSSHHPPRPLPSTAPDPDATALARALDGELALLASYDAAIQRASVRDQPPLRVARALHAVHVTALRRLAASTRTAHGIDRDLPAALRQSADALRTEALAAHRGTTAALLASIAASHQASAG